MAPTDIARHLRMSACLRFLRWHRTLPTSASHQRYQVPVLLTPFHQIIQLLLHILLMAIPWGALPCTTTMPDHRRPNLFRHLSPGCDCHHLLRNKRVLQAYEQLQCRSSTTRHSRLHTRWHPYLHQVTTSYSTDILRLTCSTEFQDILRRNPTSQISLQATHLCHKMVFPRRGQASKLQCRGNLPPTRQDYLPTQDTLRVRRQPVPDPYAHRTQTWSLLSLLHSPPHQEPNNDQRCGEANGVHSH